MIKITLSNGKEYSKRGTIYDFGKEVDKSINEGAEFVSFSSDGAQVAIRISMIEEIREVKNDVANDDPKTQKINITFGDSKEFNIGETIESIGKKLDEAMKLSKRNYY